MLVFGDPGEEARLEELIEGFLRDCKSVGCASLDDARRLMIRAGQIEQGICDLPIVDTEGVHKAQALTDFVAEIFCDLFQGDGTRNFSERLRQIEGAARELGEAPLKVRSARVTIKAPEGFGFYSLYPEQYIATADRWSAGHAGNVVVIGIRSIGTTLSAVVMAALRRRRLQVRRFTVRPTAHPFNRVCSILMESIAGAAAALIVDEGPGASGSSMSSVAKALVEAGMNPSGIFFFPGHSNPPGAAASAEARHWWKRIESCVTELGDIRWNGESIERVLLRKSNELRARHDEFVQIQDVSSGKWRALAFRDESEWPAVCLNFERTKYVCSSATGRRVLWKFDGLLNRNGGLMQNGLVRCPRHLGSSHGFIAFEWIEGTRLSEKSKGDPGLLERCAWYLARSGGPQLSKGEEEEARMRLQEMLFWNTKETLGDEAAQQKQRIGKNSGRDELPCYRDGRMSPYEWIISAEDELYKVSDYGRPRDHTIVGEQPILWDVAGFIVEWNLDGEAENHFLEALRAQRLRISADSLGFYLAAYAAFRVGQTSLCASLWQHDSAEGERLQCASLRYRAQLRRILVEQF